MTNPSPLVNINSQSQFPNGVNVTAGSTATVALASAQGVFAWSLECIGTDDLNSAAAINATLVVNSANYTATFTVPSLVDGYGCALIFKSVVNSGMDINGLIQPYLSTTFGVYALSYGLRMGAQNETVEGNATFGWLSKFNEAIRSGTFSGNLLAGDVTGGQLDNVLSYLQGNPLSVSGTITTDYVLTWNGSAWVAEAPQIGSLSGDVVGASTSNVVVNIHGASVPLAGSLTTGNTLHVSSSSALSYGPLNLAGGSNYVSGTLPVANQASQTMLGDVTGTTATSVVGALQGYAVSNTAPTTNYVLEWNGSAWTPTALPSSLPPSGAASGDLNGSYPSPLVSGIQGKTVTGGAITKGQFFVASSTSNWAATSLSGDITESSTTPGKLTVTAIDGYSLPAPSGSFTVLSYNSGVLSWATGGGVTWANDLTGSTNGNQYVAAISGNAGAGGTIPFNATSLTFGVTQSNPTINQTPIVSATGQNLTIAAQGTKGASHNGGNLYLSSGLSESATDGYVALQVGGIDQFQVGPTAITVPNYSLTISSLGTGLVHSSSLGLLSSSLLVNADVSASANIAISKLATSSFGGDALVASNGIVTVIGIDGYGIQGTATSGQYLTYNGSGDMVWTTPTSGITWANDLSGSSNTHQYVASISGSGGGGGSIAINGNALNFSNGGGSRTFGITSTNSITGPLYIQGQNTTNVSAGGSVNIISGSGTPNGSIHLETAGGSLIQLSDSAISISLFSGSAGVVHNSSVGTLSSSLIINADISSTAAISVSKLAAGTSAQLLLNNSTPTPTWTTLSGDVSITSAGVSKVIGIDGYAISGGPTTGQILEYNGTNMVWVTPSSGITWANDLAGSTSTAQYVAAISGNGAVGGTIPFNATTLQWGSGQTTFAINQATGSSSASPNNGTTLAIAAQNGQVNTSGGVTGTVGGPITITAGYGANTGSGTGGAGGAITIAAGPGGSSSSGTNGVGGNLTVISGSAGGSGVNSGNLYLATGTIGASGGTSGSIFLQTGTSSGQTTQLTIGPTGTLTAASLAGNGDGYVGVNNSGVLFWSLGTSGGGGSGITDLTGDVTAYGIGSVATTVATMQATNTVTKTSSYTINSGSPLDFNIFCNPSGAFNLTLPTPANGMVFHVWDISGTMETNNVTLVRHGSEKISGVAASRVLQTNWGHWMITSNGTDWFIG